MHIICTGPLAKIRGTTARDSEYSRSALDWSIVANKTLRRARLTSEGVQMSY